MGVIDVDVSRMVKFVILAIGYDPSVDQIYRYRQLIELIHLKACDDGIPI